MNPEQIFALLQNIADQKETPDIDPNVLKKLKEIAAKFKSEEIDEQQALRQAMQLFFPDEK